MKQFLTLYEPSKTSSSWLTKGLQILSSVVLGIDTFKAAYKSAPDAANAVAAASNQTVESLRAKLRAQGIDPDAYFDALDANIDEAGGIDALSAETATAASADAQNKAQDSSQKMWLIGGLLFLIFMGLGNQHRARRGLVRFTRRFSSRPRRRFRRFRRRRF